VARDTSNDAALNLMPNVIKAASLSAERRDLDLLIRGFDMVEFEKERIRFTAVDTRMFEQVFANKCAVADDVPASVLRAPRVVRARVRNIVIAAIEREARFTVGAPAPVGAPIKLINGPLRLALRAGPMILEHYRIAFQLNCFAVRRR
jgi:hypothetical protein